MLVLTRRKGERIVIDGGIVIQIVEIRGDRVRVGVVAPRNVTVDREEVAVSKEQQASQLPKTDVIPTNQIIRRERAD